MEVSTGEFRNLLVDFGLFRYLMEGLKGFSLDISNNSDKSVI